MGDLLSVLGRRLDQFGITIIGDVSEVRSQRVISRGNIQFHKNKP